MCHGVLAAWGTVFALHHFPIFSRISSHILGEILLEFMPFRRCYFVPLSTLPFFGGAMPRPSSSWGPADAQRSRQVLPPACRSFPLSVHLRVGFAFFRDPQPETHACAPLLLCSRRATCPSPLHPHFQIISNPHPLLQCSRCPSKLGVICRPNKALSPVHHPTHQ